MVIYIRTTVLLFLFLFSISVNATNCNAPPFDSSVKYKVGDVVSNNNSGYRCISELSGGCNQGGYYPGEDWGGQPLWKERWDLIGTCGPEGEYNPILKVPESLRGLAGEKITFDISAVPVEGNGALIFTSDRGTITSTEDHTATVQVLLPSSERRLDVLVSVEDEMGGKASEIVSIFIDQLDDVNCIGVPEFQQRQYEPNQYVRYDGAKYYSERWTNAADTPTAPYSGWSYVQQCDGSESNRPPTVSINIRQSEGSAEIFGIAEDEDGQIATIELFLNNALHETKTNPITKEYAFTINTSEMEPGRHSLMVKATDDRGASTNSKTEWIELIDKTLGSVVFSLSSKPTGAGEKATVSVKRADSKSTYGSIQLEWGTQHSLVLEEGSYKAFFEPSGNALPRFQNNKAYYAQYDFDVLPGNEGIVNVVYQSHDVFGQYTVEHRCTTCHSSTFKDLKSETVANTWLATSKEALIDKISSMQPRCTAEDCAPSVADYLWDNAWEKYKEDDSELRGKRLIRGLTKEQYLASIRDVLKVDLDEGMITNDVPGRHVLYPTYEDKTFNTAPVEEFLDAAIFLADQIEPNDIFYCELDDELDCRKSLISYVGLRLYHRPLMDDEIETLSANEDVRYTLATMTFSPRFLYRSELGHYDEESNAFKLDSYEVAAALSYLYIGTVPDDILLEKALSGELAKADAINQQAERLINSEKGKNYLPKFFSYTLETYPERLTVKDGMTPSLVDSMEKEFEYFVRYSVYEGAGNYSALLEPGYTFLNKELANFYDIDVALSDSEMEYVADSRRGGLLQLGAVHVANSGQQSTHVVKRGRLVQESLLCRDMGTPIVMPPSFIPEHQMSTREYWEKLTNDNKECDGCHKYMNPPGFALDSFGVDGRYRTEENLVDEKTGESYTRELITSGELIVNEVSVGTFSDIFGMSEIIGETAASQRCLIDRYYQYAMGYTIPNKRELDTLHAEFIERNQEILPLLESITQTESFLYRN
ncbi:hypothetical protein BSZ05_26010 [Vibrio mediterranei]|uniref:DUF1592 domain-containing protein n=1 Tax=Vibrio mediterranei TaxID=689 RepID=A0AAN1FMB1_9VIBR|nr:hypothetical protein BSZ05_26010 [Vibrio mediterranei]